LPRFLDLFIREVRGRKDGLRESLEKGRTSLLDRDFKTLFNQHWHLLPEGEISGMHLLAVDGSMGLREYANGSRLYVTRAYGLTNRGEKFRQLETGVFLSRGNEKDVGRYISQKTEYVEMKTALEAVLYLKGVEKLILIDGSLYGRMMHPLMDSPVDGDRAFLLDYMDLYAKLLRECRDANILLVGVSKDSRAEFLRDEFLHQICLKELEDLRASLSFEGIRALKRCIENLEESPDSSFRIFHGLRRKHGPLLDRFEQILLEFLHARSDFQLVLNFASQPGYSTPMEMGAVRRTKKEMEVMMRDPEGYVKRRFRKSITEKATKEGEFVNFASEVICKVLDFPTIVSFHLLFDIRDTPLRIDVPSWFFGSENTLRTFMETQFREGAKDRAEKLIRMLKPGYAGLMDYNVWLKRADEQVKLQDKDMDNLYERVLEKELGLTLIHTRGYRRVKYP